MDLVTPDIIQFFKEEKSKDHVLIECDITFGEYEPIQGQIVVQDPYCCVFDINGLQTRIFFTDPFSHIYGVQEEIDEFHLHITTDRSIIDMRFLELLSLEKYLLKQNAVILHSCYIVYSNQGIAFTAPSGTGKSTQGNLWEKLANGKVINGDRSIIQYMNEKWIVHSLPFCGSSTINFNQSYPLASVVIVNRDLHDHVEGVEHQRDLERIMYEITVNKWDYDQVQKALKLIQQLFTSQKVINLYCTPTKCAVESLKEYLDNDHI